MRSSPYRPACLATVLTIGSAGGWIGCGGLTTSVGGGDASSDHDDAAGVDAADTTDAPAATDVHLGPPVPL
jgi:hypothetical protein